MAKTFKELREDAGYTQEGLAYNLGVSISVLRGYERGRKNISGMRLGRAIKLCDMLHCTPEELLASAPDGDLE